MIDIPGCGGASGRGLYHGAAERFDREEADALGVEIVEQLAATSV